MMKWSKRLNEEEAVRMKHVEDCEMKGNTTRFGGGRGGQIEGLPE